MKENVERLEAIASKHIAALKEGKSSLIVAPTHAECRAIARVVRDRQKKDGSLSGEEHTICGCNAGLFREALHEVYIPRIHRGKAYFAANLLGARGALLSALVHFFEHGRWGSPVERAVEGESLTADDQLFVLTQAGLYLTATRGYGALEARICYERVESLCHSLNRPVLLFSALTGRWRYSLWTDKLTATMQIAERVNSLAQEQNDSALMIGAYRALAVTLYFLADFETARQNAMRGVQLCRSGGVQSHAEFLDAPAVVCLCYEALSKWHFGEIASCQATMDPNRDLVPRSHWHGKGAEVGFTRETRRSNLCRISPAKSERVRRTRIPAASLLAHPAPYLTITSP